MHTSDLGQVALLIAFPIALFGAASAAIGARRSIPSLVVSGRRSVHAVAALVFIAAIVLLGAFASHDFGVRYVAEQSSREMPVRLILAAFYGGQAGSLLYWLLALCLLSVLAIRRHPSSHPALLPYVAAALLVIEAFFLLVLAFVASPFERLPFVPANGRGLNPLLYDDGMLAHPPVLLAGYVSAAVPFAFAIAALASGRLGNEWVLAARRWVLGGWAILGSGLLLGGWWAYHVLGWGGYWGWDPVENVALLPWLTATALLHSLAVQERRGLLKVWNLSLVIATFALSIFGTFVVRSGVLGSVHSFAQSAIGPFFFAFLGLVLLVSLALLFARLPRLASPATVETLYSREATFLANNWLLIGVTFATFWGTIFPLISEAVRDVRVAVGAPFFDQVNGPLLLGLLVLMGIGPLVPWRGAGRATVWRNFRLPLLGGVVVAIAAGIAVGPAQFLAACVFGVIGFIIVGVGQDYWRAFRGQQRAASSGPLSAFITVLVRHRRRYGGYLVHLSIAGMAVGVVGSTFFKLERQVTLQPGESTTIGRYALTYRGIETQPGSGVQAVTASLDARTGDGRLLTSLAAERRFYQGWESQPATQVAISTVLPWLDDLYVVLAGWDEPTAAAVTAGRFVLPSGEPLAATFHVFVNPLVAVLWLSWPLFLAGTLLSWWPDAAAAVLAPVSRRRGVPAWSQA
ncbi:MAG: cytochrome C biogenesis protein [Dehalococcoidia bacterium]|nr:cytochrome C biogenesis protein [Dehalococcoidia bacterium]